MQPTILVVDDEAMVLRVAEEAHFTILTSTLGLNGLASTGKPLPTTGSRSRSKCVAVNKRERAV